jgi:hypothetical protein
LAGFSQNFFIRSFIPTLSLAKGREPYVLL